MLVECKQCGAPLDVGSSVSIVRCSYCNADNRVRSMRTLAEQAPAGWVPPPTWTPPQRVAQPSAPLPYRPPPKQASVQRLVLGIVLVVVVTTLCPFLLMPLLMAGAFGW